MSELGTRMAALLAALSARLPRRVVTRELIDFANRPQAELAKGVYTIVSLGEGPYQNLRGREGMDGTQSLIIIGQFKLAEKATGSEIEDAEFEMRDEVIGLLQNLPASLCLLNISSFKQSGQIDRPYGWIAFELEYVP